MQGSNSERREQDVRVSSGGGCLIGLASCPAGSQSLSAHLHNKCNSARQPWAGSWVGRGRVPPQRGAPTNTSVGLCVSTQLQGEIGGYLRRQRPPNILAATSVSRPLMRKLLLPPWDKREHGRGLKSQEDGHAQNGRCVYVGKAGTPPWNHTSSLPESG